MRGDHGRKSTNERERKLDRNFVAAFGTKIRIGKCFCLILSSRRKPKNFQTIIAYTEITALIW
jgi:hypothetical protein